MISKILHDFVYYADKELVTLSYCLKKKITTDATLPQGKKNRRKW